MINRPSFLQDAVDLTRTRIFRMPRLSRMRTNERGRGVRT
jgi:hypothetical protein